MNHTKLILIILALIAILFLSTVSKGQEPIWDSSCTQIVYTNSIFSCGNYSISNIQFSAPIRGVKNLDGKIVVEYTVTPSVTLNILKDNVRIETVVLTDSDNTYIDPDKSIKILVHGFTNGNSLEWTFEKYNPQVRITYYFRQKPNIKLSAQVDKTKYESGKDKYVYFNVTVKNIGNIPANNIDINLYSALNTNSKLLYHINTLNKDESQIISVNFDVPEVGKETQFIISTTSKIQDEQNIGKFLYTTKNISVSVVEPKQRIYVTKYIKDRIYASDNATVTITIGNSGTKDIYSIYVSDDLGNVLIPYDSNLKWEYSTIKVGSQTEIRYNAVVNKIGHFTIPATVVKYDYMGQTQSIISNIVEIDTIDVPAKYKRAISTSKSTPVPTPIATKSVEVVEPKVVETIISTPVVTETVVIPIIPPTATPKIPGFEGFFVILIIFIARTINRNL